MNTLIVCLFCAVVVTSVTGDVLNPKVQFSKSLAECQSSTHTDINEINKIFKREPIDVKVVGDVMLCVHQKLDIQNDNGEINQENFRKVLFAFNHSQKKTDLVVTNCSVKKEGATPQEAAVELVKCSQKYDLVQPPPANTL